MVARGFAFVLLALSFAGAGCALAPPDRAARLREIAVSSSSDEVRAAAQYELCLLYIEGVEVDANPYAGALWCRRAAQLGHADAQFRLGAMYLGGKGVSADPRAATRYLRRAAEANHPRAAHLLSLLYTDDSSGVDEDHSEALRWSLHGARLGDADCQFHTGVAYLTGRGVEPDPEEAVRWFLAAARQGHAFAQYRMARAYELGSGVEQNEHLAIPWYANSSARGNPHATLNLAIALAEGTAVEKDLPAAFALFERAAKSGDSYAQFNLRGRARARRGSSEELRERSALVSKGCRTRARGGTARPGRPSCGWPRRRGEPRRSARMGFAVECARERGRCPIGREPSREG